MPAIVCQASRDFCLEEKPQARPGHTGVPVRNYAVSRGGADPERRLSAPLCRRCGTIKAAIAVSGPRAIGLGLCTVDMLFVVDEQPSFDRTMRASQYLRQGGGPTPTALVAMARLGAKTSFYGKVGDDPDGDFIRAELETESVDTTPCIVVPGAFSRVALVLVEAASGERGFTTRPESCPDLGPCEIDRETITAADYVHLDDADPGCMQAARWAREAGRAVVYDGTWMHEDLDEFLDWVDFPVVSEPLVRKWMPEATPEQVVARLGDHGAKISVNTLGARGAVARWRNSTFHYPAFPIEVVDTTGAGDAFHGAFTYGLMQQWPVDDIICFASAVAALNCRQLGGRSGLPTLFEVEDFLTDRRKTWESGIKRA
ncbi:MAG: PfkB family carbohydrate kinase [Candidatus Latescibacterota bacterium]|nr:PfkB family carbohydrate kinase [Candidatus Latescibacterota bacterium]